MSTGNEVAMQQCLMGVQALQKQLTLFEQRLQTIEGRFSISPPAAAQPAAPAPQPPPRPPEGPAIRHQGVPGAAQPLPRAAAAAPSLAAALAGALGSQLGPWSGLISQVVEATVRDLAPTLQAVLAAGQGQPVPAPVVPAALPVAGAAEMTAPGTVEASELSWMAAEGLATGLPVEAVRTVALPPNYQHPPGVTPVPPAAPRAGGLVVPMPPVGG